MGKVHNDACCDVVRFADGVAKRGVQLREELESNIRRKCTVRNDDVRFLSLGFVQQRVVRISLRFIVTSGIVGSEI